MMHFVTSSVFHCLHTDLSAGKRLTPWPLRGLTACHWKQNSNTQNCRLRSLLRLSQLDGWNLMVSHMTSIDVIGGRQVKSACPLLFLFFLRFHFSGFSNHTSFLNPHFYVPFSSTVPHVHQLQDNSRGFQRMCDWRVRYDHRFWSFYINHQYIDSSGEIMWIIITEIGNQKKFLWYTILKWVTLKYQ